MVKSTTDYGQFIGNKFQPSADGNRIEVENPSDHSIIGTVPAGCSQDALKAIDLAKKAQPEWAKKPAVQRAAVLKGMANVIRDNRDALIETLVKEQNKVIDLASVEVDCTAEYLDMYAGMARMYDTGEMIPSDNPSEQIYLHRIPIGVSVGICPWNFPMFGKELIPSLTLFFREFSNHCDLIF